MSEYLKAWETWAGVRLRISQNKLEKVRQSLLGHDNTLNDILPANGDKLFRLNGGD